MYFIIVGPFIRIRPSDWTKLGLKKWVLRVIGRDHGISSVVIHYQVT